MSVVKRTKPRVAPTLDTAENIKNYIREYELAHPENNIQGVVYPEHYWFQPYWSEDIVEITLKLWKAREMAHRMYESLYIENIYDKDVKGQKRLASTEIKKHSNLIVKYINMQMALQSGFKTKGESLTRKPTGFVPYCVMLLA
jgi:hypothetical protein